MKCKAIVRASRHSAISGGYADGEIVEEFEDDNLYGLQIRVEAWLRAHVAEGSTCPPIDYYDEDGDAVDQLDLPQIEERDVLDFIED